MQANSNNYIIIFLLNFICLADIFDELGIEVKNIKKENKAESSTGSVIARTTSKALFLEYKNSKNRAETIKKMLTRVKSYYTGEVLNCCTTISISSIANVVNILKTAKTNQNEAWFNNTLVENNINIVDNIKSLNNEYILNMIFQNLKKDNYKGYIIFYDEYSINNSELILKRLTDELFYNRNPSSLFFCFFLKLDNPIIKFLESFKRIDNICFENIKDKFNGLTVEIAKCENTYTQNVESINDNQEYARYKSCYKITFPISPEEKNSTSNVPYKKTILYHDTINEKTISIKFFDAINDKLKQKYTNLVSGFKYLIVIKLLKHEKSFYNTKYKYKKLLSIEEEELKKGFLIKRTVKAYEGYNPLQSTYSYYIDNDKKFSNINYLPENIRETKRIVDMVKRIKMNLRYAYTPFLPIKDLCTMAKEKWSENEIMQFSMNAITHFKTFSISNYTNVATILDTLKSVYKDVNGYTVKEFLFNYVPLNNINDENPFKFYDLMEANLIRNIAVSDKMIEHQKYGNSFGYTIISNNYYAQQNYMLFLFPSFIRDFNNLDLTNIFENFRSNLKIKLDEIPNQTVQPNQHAIINHFLILEMVDNFIYFVYLINPKKSILSN